MTRTTTRADLRLRIARALLTRVSDRFHEGGGSFSPIVTDIDAQERRWNIEDGIEPPPRRSVRARAAYDASCKET